MILKPKVTSSTPLGCPDGSLGRKTSATLMEIERNRQLLLAKQGEEEVLTMKRRSESTGCKFSVGSEALQTVVP